MAASFNSLSYPHPRHYPSRAEVISTRDRIRELDREISKVKGQNKGSQIQLANLHHEREDLTSYIPPFRCLPIEIMTEILRLCLENGVGREKLMKICGTLRDVVTGTPTFWNKIQTYHWGLYKRSVGFIGQNQSRINKSSQQSTRYLRTQDLEFALSWANSIPLDLRIDSMSCKFRPGIITAIFSRKCLVRSLAVHISYEPAIYPVLRTLDMSALQNFSLEGSTIDKLGRFLDLAMRSSQEQMTIRIDTWGKCVDTLLQHELMQRATSLFLSIKSNDSLGPIRVTLPQLKSLEFEGNQDIIYALNLNNLETLGVWCRGDSGERLRLNTLSTQLTTLTLKKFRLASDQVSNQKARSLPNLMTLRLIGMTLEGPLRNYLELPRLRHIEMDDVEFFEPNGNPGSDEDEEYRPVLLSDMLLSPKPSSLESIALINISIDKSFIQELRSYPNLRALAFKGGNLDDLFQTFFSNLDPNTGFFPALREIEMEVTWPSSIDMSYEEFADYCASRSPRIELYGQIRAKLSLK